MFRNVFITLIGATTKIEKNIREYTIEEVIDPITLEEKKNGKYQI